MEFCSAEKRLCIQKPGTKTVKVAKGLYATTFDIWVNAADSVSTIKDGWYSLRCLDNYLNVDSNGGAELRNVTPRPYYYVERKSDGKYLGISGEMKDGVQIKAVSDDYLWNVYPEGGTDTFSLRPAENQKMVMNATGVKNIDCTWIILWTHENTDAPSNGEFRFVPSNLSN